MCVFRLESFIIFEKLTVVVLILNDVKNAIIIIIYISRKGKYF